MKKQNAATMSPESRERLQEQLDEVLNALQVLDNFAPSLSIAKSLRQCGHVMTPWGLSVSILDDKEGLPVLLLSQDSYSDDHAIWITSREQAQELIDAIQSQLLLIPTNAEKDAECAREDATKGKTGKS